MIQPLIQPRHPKNRRVEPIVRILVLTLIPGSVLALLIVTNLVMQPGSVPTVPRIEAATIATPSPAPSDIAVLPENSATATASGSNLATPIVSTPTTVPSRTVSPTALRSTDVISTVAPATVDAPTATPPPTAPPTSVPIIPTEIPETYAAITRLVIPSIGVDAAVEVKSVGSDGVMQSPSGPEVVTWYDFSSPPSGAGNAVFAGHLDYAGYGPAIFWRLGELQPGDEIEVYQQDGTTLRYGVTSIRPFAATDDARAVIGSTGSPTITLITCDGAFDGQARAYDQRLVVTGDRID